MTSPYQPPSDREEFDVDYVLQMCDNYPPPPPPEYTEVTRSRLTQPPSFEDHMASVASSLDKPMPPIEDLLQSDPQVGGVAQHAATPPQVPPPPYPGSSVTSIQPPASHHSSTHDLTEGTKVVIFWIFMEVDVATVAFIRCFLQISAKKHLNYFTFN